MPSPAPSKSAPPTELSGARRMGAGDVSEGAGVPVAERKQGTGGLLNGMHLDDCLKLLGAGSDEEKFAGLLLVTKVARPDDASAMRQVMEAVGMKFLYRLMSSPGTPNGASDTSLMYQCMALNVLSSFCSMQELWKEMHAQADFIRMAPVLLQAVQCDAMTHPAIDSVLSCLSCMAASQSGTRALCKHGGPATMVDFLQHRCVDENERKDRAIFVLSSLLAPAENPSATAEAVPKLAETLVDGKGLVRLDLLPLVARTLRSNQPDFVAKLRLLDVAWHDTMRKGLMNLLQNKLPSEYRKHILAVALAMCEHFGQSWAVPPVAAGAACADGTFVQLIVGFSNIELRMRLEEALKPQDNAEAVPTALALVEKTLQYLGEGADEDAEPGTDDGAGNRAIERPQNLRRWVDMDTDRLLKMKRDLDEAVGAIFIYLQDLQESREFGDELVLPMCRLLGLWFLEVESDDFTTKLCASLPVVCEAARFQARSSRSIYSPLYFMLPALSHLVAQDNVRLAFLRAKGHEVVAGLMKAALEGRTRRHGSEEDGDDEGSGTDLCMTGAVLLTRILALSPKAASSAPEAFRELAQLLLPVAGVMGEISQRHGADEETSEGMSQHVAAMLTLAFQVLQAAEPASYVRSRDSLSLQGYLRIFKQTVRQWVAWDAGALCLLAAGGAAAVHADVRSEMRGAGLESCLAVIRGDKGMAAPNAEAVESLLAVLVSDESSAAHEDARVRAAAEGTQESEKEALAREATLRAATHRPDAPPFVDPNVVWKMRADHAAKEIADLEEVEGREIDFGSRLRLDQVAKMTPGSTMDMGGGFEVEREQPPEGRQEKEEYGVEELDSHTSRSEEAEGLEALD